MKPPDVPITPAVRALRAANVPFTPHLYAYVDRGGTHHAATALGVAEHGVVKTLVLEADDGSGRAKPLVVLMHGDREVSTKQLARHLGVRSVQPATPAAVEKYTGYLPGGVSPFATRVKLAVYAERSVMDLEHVYLNGGKRGLLVRLRSTDVQHLLNPTLVEVAIE